MSIAVTCPSGHLLKVADNMAGRAGRCPFCREIVNVPAIQRSSEGEKSTLASRSRLGRGPSNPTASASGLPAPKSPLAGPPPAPIAPDPAAADTVLMPISLADIPPDDVAFASDQSAEPDCLRSWPNLAKRAGGLSKWAQTLPLPTAELMPRRSVRAPDPAHDIGFDTAGHKTKIIGSWRVFGDVEPPYVPESIANRGTATAGVRVPPTPRLLRRPPATRKLSSRRRPRYERDRLRFRRRARPSRQRNARQRKACQRSANRTKPPPRNRHG